MSRIVAEGERHPRAELVVAGLLVATAAAAVVSVVGYGVGWSTQAFGGALAGAVVLLGVALVVAAKTFIVTEELEEEYPQDNPEAQREVAAIIRESGTPITRKKLLGGAVGLAGTALGVALIAPAVSLGPVFRTRVLQASPWRRGRLLVDKDGNPITADDIEAGPFYTAFPVGASRKAIASPLILVRLDPSELKLPPGRENWAPEGIVAYSKICTHAGCAITLYRNPLYAPSEPQRALVCPCHYSTFDPAAGGKVLFGPAGRPLPQLPIAIDRQRRLVARGDFSTPAGPSWWGSRSA